MKQTHRPVKQLLPSWESTLSFCSVEVLVVVERWYREKESVCELAMQVNGIQMFLCDSE